MLDYLRLIVEEILVRYKIITLRRDQISLVDLLGPADKCSQMCISDRRERWRKMSLINAILEQLLNGLRTGSIYALIALGYTMVYGIAKMINFAHGDIIMVGAYTLYVCVSLLHLHPILAVIITILVCALPVSYTHLDVYKRQL